MERFTRVSVLSHVCVFALVVGIALTIGLGSPALAAKDVTIEQPILLTSAGQSPDVLMIRVLLQRAGIEATTDELATASALDGVRTLILALGGSQKGLGAAGTDPEDELKRIDELLQAAEDNGVLVIGVHIGGEGRRGPLSERFIEPTVSRVDYLIVTDEGNRDGYFNEVAQQLDIGLTTIENTLDVESVIVQMMER